MKRTNIFGAMLIGMVTLISCGTNPPAAEENTGAGTTEQTEQQTTATVTNIKPAQVEKIVKEEEAIIVDVRTPGEVSQGVIEGATVFVDYNGGNFAGDIAKLDKTKTYIVYCRSGARSAAASNIMVQQGFQHIYNLEGGIMGWPGNVVRP